MNRAISSTKLDPACSEYWTLPEQWRILKCYLIKMSLLPKKQGMKSWEIWYKFSLLCDLGYGNSKRIMITIQKDHTTEKLDRRNRGCSGIIKCAYIKKIQIAFSRITPCSPFCNKIKKFSIRDKIIIAHTVSYKLHLK